MAHYIIIGMTESGKTTLAKIVCRKTSEKAKTAVLDPLRSQDWGATFQTDDPDEFLKYLRENKSHVVFVDEGATTIGRFNEEMEWLATQSRHWGHSCFFISQRATQMATTIRHQCSKAYIFAVGSKDAEMFAEEWNEPGLKNLPRIQKGEFYLVSRFGALQKGSIDFEKGLVYLHANASDDVINPARNDSGAGDAPSVDDRLPVNSGKSSNVGSGKSINET